MKIAALLCACVGWVGCTSQPVEASYDESSLAIQWLRVIEAEDWQAMGTLLHTDAVYEDPTMDYFGTGAIHLVGRDSIVDFWRESDEDSGAQYLDYDILCCFESADTTVLNAVLHVEVKGDFWKVARNYLPLTSNQTTIITIRGDKISHVADYFDYHSMVQQIDALRVQYGEVLETQSAPREAD